MKFQLPEDPKQRTIWLTVIGAAAVLIVILVVVFGIMPMVDQKKKFSQDITDLDKKLKEANTKIEKMKRDTKDNAEVLAELKTLSDKYLLKSELGNSLPVARDILVKHAKEVDVPLDPLQDIRQLSLESIPYPGGKVPVCKIFTARVTLKCGFHDVMRFIRALEKSNPYLCISGLTIMGQKGDPYKHQITFEIQWPAWADANMPANIEAQLKEDKQETANVEAKK
jgi:hypothetical protein